MSNRSLFLHRERYCRLVGLCRRGHCVAFRRWYRWKFTRASPERRDE